MNFPGSGSDLGLHWDVLYTGAPSLLFPLLPNSPKRLWPINARCPIDDGSTCCSSGLFGCASSSFCTSTSCSAHRAAVSSSSFSWSAVHHPVNLRSGHARCCAAWGRRLADAQATINDLRRSIRRAFVKGGCSVCCFAAKCRAITATGFKHFSTQSLHTSRFTPKPFIHSSVNPGL